jgi:hypothetical protein
MKLERKETMTNTAKLWISILGAFMQILSFIPNDDMRWAITWRVLAALYFNAVLVWNWRLQTKLERLNKEPEDVRAVLSNSLGFGGHNATLCFKKVTDQ